MVHNEVGGDVTGTVVQAGHIGSIGLPAPAPLALAGLPPDEGFSGRAAELALLADVLAPDGVPVATVAGPPGVGKSALAVRAAILAEESFPGGVLFVNLHGYDETRRIDANAALGSLLRALGVRGEHVPPDQGERETLYRSELARREQRVLVVADNASDTDQVLPLRPGGTRHRLLITSRHTLPVPKARRIEVDVLPPSDSIAVLNEALRAADGRTIEDPAVAAELANLCGHLPLALRITAELLADQPDSAAELVDILRDTRSRLGELAYGDSAAVRAAFDASYQHLPADQARLFRLLAVHPGPHFSRAAAAALAGEPIDVTRRLLDGLRRAHLIEPAAGSGRYRFHDLLLLYAKERTEPAERPAAIERLLGAYREILDTEGMDAERPNMIAIVLLAADTDHHSHVLDLADGLQPYFETRRRLSELVTVNGLGVVAARRLGDRLRQSQCLCRLGVAYRGLQSHKHALSWLEEALGIQRDMDNKRDAGNTLNSIGAVYRGMGELDRAERYFHEGLALCRETGDLNGQSISLNSLGGVYKAVHRFKKSLDAYQSALELQRETGDKHGEGITLNGLGNLFRDLGRYDEAIAHFTEALAVRRAAGDDLGEAITLRGLGSTYLGLRRTDQALTYLRQALEGFRQANSPQDVDAVAKLIDTVSHRADPDADIWSNG